MAGRARGAWHRMAAAAVACAALVSACGVRWETEPEPVPSPDATTLARDTLAVAEQTVLDAARAEDDAGAEAAASAHLDALGGVYIAFPDAPPTASASPAAPPALDAAIAAARVAARDAAASTDDANLRSIAVSLDLAWALYLAWGDATPADGPGADATSTVTAEPEPTADATAGAVATPSPRALPLPDGTVSAAGASPGSDTAVNAEVLAELAVLEDEARFAYETAAAQVFGEERAAALARSDLHGALADALAAVASTDARTPLYQLRGVDLRDAAAREGLLRDLERDLAERYAALAVTAASGDRDWLLNACFGAYVSAMEAGAFPAVADLPILPGLEPAP